MNKKRRRRSVVHKIEHLKLEVEERNELMQEYESAFLQELSKLRGINSAQKEEITTQSIEPAATIINEIKDQSGQKEDHEETEISSEISDAERPEWMKKLWKSIALLTHPDRTGGDEKMTQMYKRASEAWRSGSQDILLEIAIELGIELDDQDEAALQILESRAQDLAKKIKEMESSILWAWGNAPPDKKDAILKLYMISKQKQN